jgi:coenzyme F420-reducing hydrogenase alpha subunit
MTISMIEPNPTGSQYQEKFIAGSWETQFMIAGTGALLENKAQTSENHAGELIRPIEIRVRAIDVFGRCHNHASSRRSRGELIGNMSGGLS